MNPLPRRRLSAAAATVLAGLGLSLIPGPAAFAVPVTPHQMPFPCGETWTGSTRGSHTPSMSSIDWNRSGDQGDPVVASAAGIVSKADSTSNRSYGHHVIIDHGNGESSVYGHLDAVTVATGQTVDQGTMIGTVGNTGNSHGAHLHFEERTGKSVVPASFGGVPYFYGNLTSFNCVDVPVAADFTGDAIAEVAVFRRGKKSSFVVNDPAGERIVPFGNATDEPVVGDWDGNGAVDVGVWRAKKSKFRLKTTGKVLKVGFGLSSDRAIVGDWDGDGADDLGVYRAAEGAFYLRQAAGTSAAIPVGDADDIPVSGDWDGDGVSDLGVYDQASATFTLRTADAAGQVVLSPFPLGVVGDIPVVGDWDGNGISDLGVWTPTTATFTQGIAAAPVGRTLPGVLEAITSRLDTSTVTFGLKRR